MVLSTIVYWLTLFAIIYPYLGYPIALWLLTRMRGTYTPTTPNDDYLPSVTLIISAYNESAVIDSKIKNALALDYPTEKLGVMVISDASSDGTDDIVNTYASRDPRIRLCRQDQRRGKTAGLNIGIEQIDCDVLVFSDANAMYEADAIRQLVAPLEDSAIGYVVGAAHYSDSDDGEAQQSEELYWRYELWLKEMESACASVVGGDGAIYAIRRELYWPLREDDINDFVNPLQIVNAGYRGVFIPAARCYEEGADSFAKEFGRKRRIVNRSWRAFLRYGSGLRTAHNPDFVFQILSHKVLRWFAFPALLGLFASNLVLLLARPHWIYSLTLIGIIVSALLAWRGHQLVRRDQTPPKRVYLFYYFYLVNLAALLGIYDEARGVRHSIWDHVRKPAS